MGKVLKGRNKETSTEEWTEQWNLVLASLQLRFLMTSNIWIIPSRFSCKCKGWQICENATCKATGLWFAEVFMSVFQAEEISVLSLWQKPCHKTLVPQVCGSVSHCPSYSRAHCLHTQHQHIKLWGCFKPASPSERCGRGRRQQAAAQGCAGGKPSSSGGSSPLGALWAKGMSTFCPRNVWIQGFITHQFITPGDSVLPLIKY